MSLPYIDYFDIFYHYYNFWHDLNSELDDTVSVNEL